MNRKQQGDIGVAAAILYYTKKGFVVSIPATDSARYDLVVDNGTKLNRVQCKTTGYSPKDNGIFIVQLSTQGGNQTWNREKKRITVDECDLVFVYCLNGTMYEFPVEFIEGRCSLNLGLLCKDYTLAG